MENISGTSPRGKILISLFLPCSENAVFDDQLNCPKPALGKTEVFESPVLSTPSLGASNSGAARAQREKPVSGSV